MGTTLFSGCRLWKETSAVNALSAESSTAEIDEMADSPLLSYYAQGLEKDIWQKNRDWSPVSTKESIPLPWRTRWILSEKLLEIKPDSVVPSQTKRPNTKEKNDKRKEEVTKRKEPKTWKQHFRHIFRQEEKSTLAVPGLGSDEIDSWAYFSKQNNLRGWNAAILLTQKRNQDARKAHFQYSPLANILERIVTEPLTYDVATGNAVTKLLQKKEGDNKKKKVKKEDEKQPKTATISIAMRAAAAEGWCLLLARSVEDPIEGLAPVGRLLERAELPIEIHAELFRGAAKWVPPVDIPRLDAAFQDVRNPNKSAPQKIRVAAIDACLIYANTQFKTTKWNENLYPVEIMNCQNDPEYTIRKKFGQWLSVTKHPRAFSLLKSQLYDQQTVVREAALVSLGRLQTKEAMAELQQQMKRLKADKIRIAAVRGLSFWGTEEIAKYANDASPHIRLAVAVSLSKYPSVPSALVLQKLILNSSPEVQKKGVEAVSTWSDKIAIPLLITGFRDSSLVMTRELCLAQLRQRTLTQKPISANASVAERKEFVEYLIKEFHLSSGYLKEIQQARFSSSQTTKKIDAARQQELEQWVTDLLQNEQSSSLSLAAYQHLSHLERTDISLIESLLLKTNAKKKEVFFHDLLPRTSEVYRLLQNFESSDILKKRKAAKELAQLSKKKTPSVLAIKRLHFLMLYCQDQLVWRYVMQAISYDATDENGEIAHLAIQSTWWDIRVLGCEYVAQHGRPQYAFWLLPLFEDTNNHVRLAAIKAAGKCNHQVVLDGLRPQKKGDQDLPGLRTLLTDSHREIHFETVLSMSRLNDEQAMQELIRMSHSENRKQKERAISAMGKTGQSRFVQHLIRLGWIESTNSTRRVILETLEELVPKEKQPVHLSRTSGYDEQIKKWFRWNEQHKSLF